MTLIVAMTQNGPQIWVPENNFSRIASHFATWSNCYTYLSGILWSSFTHATLQLSQILQQNAKVTWKLLFKFWKPIITYVLLLTAFGSLQCGMVWQSATFSQVYKMFGDTVLCFLTGNKQSWNKFRLPWSISKTLNTNIQSQCHAGKLETFKTNFYVNCWILHAAASIKHMAVSLGVAVAV